MSKKNFSLSMLTTCAEDIRPYPMPGATDTIVRATAASYDLLREYNDAVSKNMPLKNLQARLIAACIIEDDSNRLAFASSDGSPDDKAVLAMMSQPGTARIMLALLGVALMRNGLKDELTEEVEKK